MRFLVIRALEQWHGLIVILNVSKPCKDCKGLRCPVYCLMPHVLDFCGVSTFLAPGADNDGIVLLLTECIPAEIRSANK